MGLHICFSNLDHFKMSTLRICKNSISYKQMGPKLIELSLVRSNLSHTLTAFCRFTTASCTLEVGGSSHVINKNLKKKRLSSPKSQVPALNGSQAHLLRSYPIILSSTGTSSSTYPPSSHKLRIKTPLSLVYYVHSLYTSFYFLSPELSLSINTCF